MSWEHANAALLLEGIPPAAKTVLAHVAQPACSFCGLAWPGVSWLEAKTGLGRTAVKDALAWLIAGDLLRIFAYPHGGKGRSTEYIVLPQHFPELSTPRCGICVEKQQTGRHATGMGVTKQAATRPVRAIPVAGGGPKGPPDGHQSVIESESVRKQEENSPAARPSPSDPHPPLSRAENAARARALVEALSLNLGTETPPAPKDAPTSAATAPLREEAQDRDRPEAD